MNIHLIEEKYDALYTDYQILKTLQMKTNEENQRLNNIIDELEKYLKKYIDDGTVIEEYGDYSTGCAYYYEEVLDKLKELKEGK